MHTAPNMQIVQSLRTVMQIASRPWTLAERRVVFANVDLECPFCDQETVTGQEPHAQRCEGAS